MLLVLFGRAGVGKNYVGEILGSEFGFLFYDATEDQPCAMRQAIRRLEAPTPEMRREHAGHVGVRVKNLLIENGDVAVGIQCPTEASRHHYVVDLPEARVVEIEAPLETCLQRIESREGYFVPRIVSKRAAALYEPLQMPHETLYNVAGRTEVVEQLQVILRKLGFFDDGLAGKER